MVQSLISSPGPDGSLLGTYEPPLYRIEPQAVVFPTAVTPPPAPLPSGGSWLDQKLAELADAVATGRASAQQAQADAQRLKSQVDSLDIVATVEQTLTDVHRAGQLQQMLPVVVLVLGVLLGRPLVGAAAAALVWAAGRQQ